MHRIEKVEQCVRKIAENDRTAGVTAEEIANLLGIWRSDASRDLNSLVKSGILEKTETYPVRFFLKSEEKKNSNNSSGNVETTPPFQRVIGYNGSLKSQIQTARAAASYPPYGLNTFIIGESGVGKSMLAEEIWHYVCAYRKDTDVPFMVYNCAEHADNPQLLLSHLFGHEKGAFTGADQRKTGIIELADKGV